MYYWDYKGTYLILTDAEEMALVRELSGGDLLERIGYNTNKDTRRKYERTINRYLKTELLRDPEGFHNRFVFRCWHGAEAKAMFSKFLDAYGRATRLATIGRWRKADLGEELVEQMVHRGEEDMIYISLLNGPRFWWLGFREVGALSFARSEIVTLTGTVDNFALLGRRFHIRFGRDAVRVLLESNATA